MVSCLNFKKIDSEVSISKEDINCFDLKWDDEVSHTFKACSASDLQLWMEDLQ